MDFTAYFQALLALLIVLGIIGLAGLLVSRVIPLHRMRRNNGKTKRIEIIEVKMLDMKRSIVLFKCDDKEYLVLLGSGSETVIDSRQT